MCCTTSPADLFWIFSDSWSTHLQHVRAILQRHRDHKLALKRSKCFFGATVVAYLAHVISAQGVVIDAKKVEALQAWPPPQTVRAVRSSLEVTGYYRKFIRLHEEIVALLTQLLKWEAFCWTPAAFDTLKTALTSSSTVGGVLFDFTATFINCDSCGSGFGVVLHQGSGPIAFFNRAIAPHHAKLATYERELIGLIKAMHYWRPYVWARPFVVRTDHYNLKYLLD